MIWGTGREGIAAFHFIRRYLPDQAMIFVDESAGEDRIPSLDAPVVRQADHIATLLDTAEVVIKSPGVSLYHPLLIQLKTKGVPITSLLNLWAAEPRDAKTICVTGTKGKSTTGSLITHVLQALGKNATILGNIGVPVSEAATDGLDYIIIETSSYQAANFNGQCDVAVLTSLYPEHLDWHKTVATYYSDKLNLLRHARIKIINAEADSTIEHLGIVFDDAILSNAPSGIHIRGEQIFSADHLIGILNNSHLARHHNLVNVCTVLTVLQSLDFDLHKALRAMETFKGLPHRQQELGIRDGLLYVDDSISTTPQSAIAAMESYQGKPITLIVGGQDRGIDYTPVVTYIADHNIASVLYMGPSGARIADALRTLNYDRTFPVTDMKQIVNLARHHTPTGGVILLSPAAPSYGFFKNFEERGRVFAQESGF